MLGMCLDFCAAQKDKITIEKHKVSSFFLLTFIFSYSKNAAVYKRPCAVFQSAVLDLYIKSVLMSKTKPQLHILDKTRSLLRHVSHSEFRELLLPTVQKTMLRSPENAMQSETVNLLSD